jgi:CDP-diacylglycerol--glycerol-3-phosphate 3-phosphatidyltransferase
MMPAAEPTEPARPSWTVALSPDRVAGRAFAWGALALLAAAAGVGSVHGSASVGRFLGATLPVWLFVAGVLRWLRACEGSDRVPAPLGAATTVTLARGWLVSALAGFVLVPTHTGFLAWMPAAFYTTAALCDLLDGYLARRLGQESPLGARLDVILDALGLVVGPLAAIALGRLPPWYLLVGAAYYLFHFGLWNRRRRGLPIYLHRLKPNPHTRMYAGYQMGLVATVLFPVLQPPGTTIAATLFMIPPLARFVRDYLVTTGRLDPDGPAHRRLLATIDGIAGPFLPIARVAAAAGLALLVARGELPPALLALAILLLLGVFTRLVAFGATIALTLALARQSTALLLATDLLTLTVLLGGGGRPALWNPDERWMLRRVGGPR